MRLDRRRAIAGAVALAAIGPARACVVEEQGMYGLIGRMRAAPGKRNELLAILLESSAEMPGCLSYVVAEDVADADAIWITEVWDGEASHKASLQLPAVQAAIGKARPIIAGFDSHTVTRPVGGVGLRA